MIALILFQLEIQKIIKIMSQFHATQETMNVDGKRKPTYEQLVEQVKIKDKRIEELMIGDGDAGHSKTEVNKIFSSADNTFLYSFVYSFLCR